MTIRSGARIGGGIASSARAAYRLLQSAAGLFAAGSILYGAHTLFLRYYQNEWRAVQFAGVDDCARTERIANGDLFDGQTFCHRPENFVPWIEVYKHHPVAAGIYYGSAVLIIVLIGAVWYLAQARLAPKTPFGGAAKPIAPSENEHLR